MRCALQINENAIDLEIYDEDMVRPALKVDIGKGETGRGPRVT